jgi:hypothetical protein
VLCASLHDLQRLNPRSVGILKQRTQMRLRLQNALTFARSVLILELGMDTNSVECDRFFALIVPINIEGT